MVVVLSWINQYFRFPIDTQCRNLADKIPAEARQLLLPAIAVERYLERLRQVDFHLADGNLQRRDSLLPLAYYWNNFRRKY